MELVISQSRARRVASRDAGQFLRAVASLLGLAVAIAAAVGLGSMMGGSDPRVPVAQDPVVSEVRDPGGSTGTTSADVVDTLFGDQSDTGNSTGGGAGKGDAQDSQGGNTTDPRDSADVDLPDEDATLDPPGPIKVPVIPTLPDADVDEVIGDLTRGTSPDTGLIEDLLGPVDEVTGPVGGLLK